MSPEPARAALAAEAAVVGAAFGWVAYTRLAQLGEPGAGPRELLALLAALAAGAAYGGLSGRWLAPHLADWSRLGRRVWKLGCLCTGALLLVAAPLSIPANPLARTHELSILATGEKNPSAESREVWLLEVLADGRTQIPPQAFSVDGAWEMRDGVLLSYQEQPARLRWCGPVERQMVLRFLAHPWSGVVQVEWNGELQRIDLYHPSQSAREAALPAREPAAWARLLGGTGAVVAHILAAGAIVFLVGTLLASRAAPPVQPPARYEWALLAAAPAGAWAAMLAGFWPGLLSPDSLEQWREMTTGALGDAHPAFHTLTNWLLTRVWMSPAAVAAAQITAMALICGWSLHQLRHQGLPRWLAGVVCGLMAALPANGAMVITLWKDVPYSICFLALCILVTQGVATRGASLRRWSTAAALGVVAALVTLYRHNGAPAAFAALLALAVVYWRAWAWSIVSLGLAVGLVLVVRGPLLQRLEVDRSAVATWWGSPLVHLISAHIDHQTPLTVEERAFVEQIRPPGPWPHDPYYSTTIGRDGGVNREFVRAHRDEAAQLLWRLTQRRPLTTLRRVAERSALVWRIRQPPNSIYYCTALESQHEPRVQEWSRELGVEPVVLLPWWRTFLADLVHWTRTEWGAVFWRAALPMYLLLAGCAVAAVRARCWHYLLIALPVLAHSLVVAIVTPGQDFRYQYPVYAAGILLAPFLLWSAGAPPPRPPLSEAGPDTCCAARR
jgi:hypothetical protein